MKRNIKTSSITTTTTAENKGNNCDDNDLARSHSRHYSPILACPLTSGETVFVDHLWGVLYFIGCSNTGSVVPFSSLIHDWTARTSWNVVGTPSLVVHPHVPAPLIAPTLFWIAHLHRWYCVFRHGFGACWLPHWGTVLAGLLQHAKSSPMVVFSTRATPNSSLNSL